MFRRYSHVTSPNPMSTGRCNQKFLDVNYKKQLKMANSSMPLLALGLSGSGFICVNPSKEFKSKKNMGNLDMERRKLVIKENFGMRQQRHGNPQTPLESVIIYQPFGYQCSLERVTNPSRIHRLQGAEGF